MRKRSRLAIATVFVVFSLQGCNALLGNEEHFRPREKSSDVRRERDASVEPGDAGPDSGDASPAAVEAGPADPGPAEHPVRAGSGTEPSGSAGSSGASPAASAGRSGGPSSEVTPMAPAFEVVAHAPGRGDTIQDVTQPIRIDFSHPADRATIGSETVAISRAKLGVAGSWSFDDDSATFTPQLAWPLAGEITVDLSAAVRSSDGRPLTPVRFSFTVRDGTWTQTDIGPGWNRVDLSVAPNGNAAVCWADLTSTWGAGGVFIKTWKPGAGWAAPLRASVDTSQVLSPNVAINDTGHLVAAFRVADAAFARRSLDGTTWSDQAYLGGTGILEISRPEFVLSADDHAFGVVQTYHTSHEVASIDGLTFELGTAQLAPYAIGTPDNGYDSGAQIVLHQNEPLVVWQESGARPGIWFMEGAPSGSRVQLSAAGAVTSAPAIAASDEARSVIVAWEQSEGAVTSIWAARRAGMAPFEPPQKVSTATGTASAPAIAMDATGSAWLLWQQQASGGSDRSEVWGSEWRPDSKTWSAPELISAVVARAAKPSIVREPGGNAVAAWIREDSAASASLTVVHTGRFVRDWGWLATSRQDFAPSNGFEGNGTVNEVVLGMDASGRALAGWLDDLGVHVARFE
ncbi:MAG TPA: Ig-like domain-containing protein [Polyangiales bacterium]|nr:Ig-like domain-containing protein [Polyangiales bacterium]